MAGLRRPYIAPVPANKGLGPRGSGATRACTDIVRRNAAVRRCASIAIGLYLDKSLDFRLQPRLQCFLRIQRPPRK